MRLYASPMQHDKLKKEERCPLVAPFVIFHNYHGIILVKKTKIFLKKVLTTGEESAIIPSVE